MTPPTYAYVSLFGISSINDLRAAILAAARPSATVGKSLSFEAVNKNWRRMALSSLNRFYRVFSKIDNSVFKNVTMGLAELAPAMIHDMVICLDDLERLNTSGLPHDILLGFISTLKENSNCKVVIILNEDQLPNRSNDFEKYREKLIDAEFEFRPTVSEILEWGVPTTTPEYAYIRDCASNLGIKNVRVLKHICRVVEVMWPTLKDMHGHVINTAIHSVVLQAWCYFDKSGDAPDIDFVQKHNSIFSTFERDERRPETSPEQYAWIKIMEGYRFIVYDELDDAVYQVIRQGFVEETDFVAQIDKRNQQASGNDLETQFADAWKLFHGSFDDNSSELISELERTFKIAVRQISPLNLNGVVVLLRELKASMVADELIDFYVASRKSEPELFDLDSYAFAGDVTDPRILAAFKSVTEPRVHMVTLADAVKTIAARKGWTPADQQSLAAATAEDLYQLFKRPVGIDLPSAVNACLQFNDAATGATGHIRANTIAALRRLASESDINAARVRRLGIELEEETLDNPDDSGGP